MISAGRIHVEVLFTHGAESLDFRWTEQDETCSVVLNDSGVSSWKSLEGQVDKSVIKDFVATLKQHLSTLNGDCGTHGFWVLLCRVELVDGSDHFVFEAREGNGFASEPLAESLLELLDGLSRTSSVQSARWKPTRSQVHWLAAILGFMVFALASYWAWQQK